MAAAPRAQAPARAGDPGGEKKKKGIVGKLILLLLVVVLIAGGVVCYLYDYFGVRTAIVGFFIEQDQQYVTRLEELDLRAAELAAKEEEQTAITAEQEATQARLDAQQAQIDAQLAQLTADQDSFNTRVTEFDQSIEEFDEVVATFVAMDTKNAAAILESWASSIEAARILAAMEPDQNAGILDEMTTQGALRLAQAMLALAE